MIKGYRRSWWWSRYNWLNPTSVEWALELYVRRFDENFGLRLGLPWTSQGQTWFHVIFSASWSSFRSWYDDPRKAIFFRPRKWTHIVSHWFISEWKMYFLPLVESNNQQCYGPAEQWWLRNHKSFFGRCRCPRNLVHSWKRSSSNIQAMTGKRWESIYHTMGVLQN